MILNGRKYFLVSKQIWFCNEIVIQHTSFCVTKQILCIFWMFYTFFLHLPSEIQTKNHLIYAVENQPDTVQKVEGWVNEIFF